MTQLPPEDQPDPSDDGLAIGSLNPDDMDMAIGWKIMPVYLLALGQDAVIIEYICATPDQISTMIRDGIPTDDAVRQSELFTHRHVIIPRRVIGQFIAGLQRMET